MQIIESVNNDLVKKLSKLLQKKYREEERLFLIEGEKGVCEAKDLKLQIVDIFIDKSREDLIKFYKDFNVIITNEKVLSKISETKTPPPIIASVRMLKNDINSIDKNAQLIIILENIKDAGNLGTIIRTAAAFGVNGIILSGECVDLYSPKVIRSSVGNIFKIPVYISKSFKEIKQYFNKSTFYATSVDETKPLLKINEIKFKKPSVIIFGSEADGITDEVLKSSDFCVTIPMKDNVESLNLAVSTGVVLYEFSR